MKQRLGLCGLVFILGAVAAWSSLVWAQPQNAGGMAQARRLDVVGVHDPRGNAIAIRIDMKTGQTWLLGGGGNGQTWQNINEGGKKPLE